MFRSKRVTAATTLAFAILIMLSGAPAWACDCRADGRIDVLDVLVANQIAAGLIPPPSPVGGCDPDGTGTVTILDVLLIAQFVSGANPNACNACATPVDAANAPLDDFGVESPVGVDSLVETDDMVKVEALGEDD